ncbi:MAG: hypothetical protein WCR97_00630 [Bacilli bacterium]
MNEVENIEALYLGDNKDVLNAINEKTSWIFKTFYVPYDSAKDSFYAVIDSINKKSILFGDVSFDSSLFDDKTNNILKEISKIYCEIKLYDKIDAGFAGDFYIEYDFTKMSLRNYQDLVANFYHLIALKDLNINYKDLQDSVLDQMKCLIAGSCEYSKIILSRNNVNNFLYNANVCSKIYYKKTINPKIYNSIKEICNRIGIELVEMEG